MNDKIVKREDLRNLLLQWSFGKISPSEVHEWAGTRYRGGDKYNYTDWENDENSVTGEILAALDRLDMDLTVAEDVPIFLKFLDTRIGCFDEGYREFNLSMEKIDRNRRRKTLKKHPLYSIFCKQD